MRDEADSCQASFTRRFGGLTNPHVRALAWLLDSPDLLDPARPHWQGRIATLPPLDESATKWLHILDREPAPLELALAGRVHTRLGLYAEQLMAFYFRSRGELLAHGLQVRAERNATIGEFDFLLTAGAGAARHLEFATKFYLLEGVAPDALDTLVGPNLADSLGQKMRKITSKQLELSRHPAAQAVLPRPVVQAQALVKGWLFYRRGTVSGLEGLTANHCRGTWCAADELDHLEGQHFVHIPRMLWLAPLRVADGEDLADRLRSGGAAAVLDRASLADAVAMHFDAEAALPMLVASMRHAHGAWHEYDRAFIVPLDWRTRAANRRVS